MTFIPTYYWNDFNEVQLSPWQHITPHISVLTCNRLLQGLRQASYCSGRPSPIICSPFLCSVEILSAMFPSPFFLFFFFYGHVGLHLFYLPRPASFILAIQLVGSPKRLTVSDHWLSEHPPPPHPLQEKTLERGTCLLSCDHIVTRNHFCYKHPDGTVSDFGDREPQGSRSSENDMGKKVNNCPSLHGKPHHYLSHNYNMKINQKLNPYYQRARVLHRGRKPKMLK